MRCGACRASWTPSLKVSGTPATSLSTAPLSPHSPPISFKPFFPASSRIFRNLGSKPWTPGYSACSTMATWRQMTSDDISQLMQVADTVHPGLPESDYVFAERARLFPKGCLILSKTNDNGEEQVYGYTISHPITKGQPPALDSLLGEIHEHANQYYIHDVAILKDVRSLGHAGRAVRMLLEVAEGLKFTTTCIVSVYGTGPFWQRFGFQQEPVDDFLREKLIDYGDDAVYMVRENGVEKRQ
ncbi:hypothetical protein QBC37DRAFT_433327 [Rhypophila decipiens]|uniref:N-acetyltransferase domain-containing protein n=1 Tax=Rhypophila decipiens TaxID=261697 RepID=A0AAN7B1K4_9PEZI|nr:hypothetical protein QBC37DRAFT_433327 [Rhypophila decipiens]